MSEVFIAGCGVSGGFFALRALQLGFRPILFCLPRSSVAGVEIIPASAHRLLDALGLGTALTSLDAGLSRGLERRMADGTSDFVPGRSLHVERLKLREVVLAEAVRRGAQIRSVARLPDPSPGQFCVDATGQRAVWSRPVVRRNTVWADIFSGPGPHHSRHGRVAMFARGWAYRASDRHRTTVGVIGRYGRPPAKLDPQVGEGLLLGSLEGFEFIGRRPAFIQWASSPVEQDRLSIGDAAFCHDPIGGRGISFALGSAFAAATALQTWRDEPQNRDAAAAYYDGYVRAEIKRHLDFLSGSGRFTAQAQASVDIPSHVRWSARLVKGAVARGARVSMDHVIRLPGGSATRWLGSFDLLELRRLCRKPVATNFLLQRLCEETGIASDEAMAAISWALRHEMLSAVSVESPDG